MRKPSILFPLLAAIIFALAGGLDYYRHRFVRSDEDLFRFLPQQNATTFYANVEAVRRAGLLTLFAGSATAREADYGRFIRETHFDYEKDMDAVAGALDASRLFLLVRGRFEWSLIREYAKSHGGHCDSGACELPSSTPGRWIWFRPLQPDVMALTTAPDRNAIDAFSIKREVAQPLPVEPVWIKIPHAVLEHPPELPTALRMFVASIAPADSATFSLSAAGPQSPAELLLAMDARCGSALSAQTMRMQLELETKFLKITLARNHVQPGVGDLLGVLTAGTFRSSGYSVIGEWPLRRELLNSVQ